MQGSPIPCDKEGTIVEIPWISNDPCISCNCQNKEVVCHKELCPSSKSCYFLLYGQETKSCCDFCKGCNYKGQSFSSGDEWTDDENPCIFLTCQGGVVTERTAECYTPCRNPVPPEPGKCCPTCPGECRSSGRSKTEELPLPMPLTDPCVKCVCENGSMVCAKKACPVLPCPESKFIHKPGTCCPECVGTRRVFMVEGKCLLGTQILKESDRTQYDDCTHCRCNDSTSICSRPSCPPLDCWPEYQVKGPGECCAKCKAPEQSKAVCMANGKVYQDGDSWRLEKCTQCVCRGGHTQCSVQTCDARIVCPPKHSLKTLPGACCPSCVEDDGICRVFGDPHYKTFDGRMYNYQGSCKYVLVKDCKGKSFSVEVLNDSRYSKAFSWTKSVTVKANGTKVRLGQNLKVHVNQKPVKLPYVQLGVLSVFQEGFTALVRTNIGVKVMWDGDSFLEVSVPSHFKGRLCGLCGNYNGKIEDDFRTRKGVLAPTTEEFASSWRVGRMKRCTLTPPSQESVCNRNWDIRVRAIRECNVLKSPVFRPCHRVVDAMPYFRSCLIDSCECRPRDRCYCESLTAYARECAQAGKILEWRSASGCDGGRCSNGQQFMNCAPPCKRTCRKPKRDKSCKRPCRPGCYCPPGTVWHRKKCIPLDECPT